MQNENLNKKLIKLVKEGNKVKAVKLYRDTTGVGVKEAKEYVDQLQTKTIDSLTIESLPDEEQGELDEDVLFQIHRHLKTGSKLKAVKLYRDTTGVGIKEAKEYVDQLQTKTIDSLIIESLPDDEQDELDEDVLFQIHRHLKTGSKLKAIRLYMRATGADLSDGKRYIDNLYKELGLGGKNNEEEIDPFSRYQDSDRILFPFCVIVILLLTLFALFLFLV